MMFIYKTAKFAPGRTNLMEIFEIFVQQTLTNRSVLRDAMRISEFEKPLSAVMATNMGNTNPGDPKSVIT